MLSLQIRLSPAQLNTCQAAADNASLSIQAWTIQALEHAARHQLQPHPPEPAVTDAPPGSSRP